MRMLGRDGCISNPGLHSCLQTQTSIHPPSCPRSKYTDACFLDIQKQHRFFTPAPPRGLQKSLMSSSHSQKQFRRPSWEMRGTLPSRSGTPTEETRGGGTLKTPFLSFFLPFQPTVAASTPRQFKLYLKFKDFKFCSSLSPKLAVLQTRNSRLEPIPLSRDFPPASSCNFYSSHALRAIPVLHGFHASVIGHGMCFPGGEVFSSLCLLSV